jgi:hypothetical protein
MTDNDLIALFTGIIITGLAARGYSSVPVIAAYQPTLQGVNESPTVFFSKVGDRRYGFLESENNFNESDEEMVKTETQLYETTFNIQVWAIQNPATPSAPTASDLANTVAMILQCYVGRTALLAAGVGILRITDIRNPYFVDDKEIFEANANFDFTLTHKQTNSSIVSVVVPPIQSGIYPI